MNLTNYRIERQRKHIKENGKLKAKHKGP